MPALPANPIFISYSRRDDETMRKIAFFLRDKGFKVWVDNEKLIPGTPAWEESIENAIKKAFAVIVILSPDSKNSEWVRREITYSDQFQKRVFPVLVKGTEEMSLPIRLVTRQYVDFRANEEAGLEALLSAITFYLEQKQTLEMKRPQIKNHLPAASSITASTTQGSEKKTSIHWMIPVGIIMALCIIGVGAVWTGYRLYSSSVIPVTGAETSDPINAVITPTEAIRGTSTNTPTSEPAPVDIGIPIPAPDSLTQYLNDVQIISLDTFDDSNGEGWEVQAGKIENGVMEIYGNDGWNGAWRDRVFMSGEGALIDFSFIKGSTFTVHMNNGLYGSDMYRRFGIYFEHDFPLVDLYIGDYKWEEFSKNSGFQTDMFYTLLIARLSEGEFAQIAWETSTQTVVVEFRKKFDGMPAASTWTFLIQVPEGTIQFDNFTEIKFSGAR